MGKNLPILPGIAGNPIFDAVSSGLSVGYASRNFHAARDRASPFCDDVDELTRVHGDAFLRKRDSLCGQWPVGWIRSEPRGIAGTPCLDLWIPGNVRHLGRQGHRDEPCCFERSRQRTGPANEESVFWRQDRTVFEVGGEE